MKNTLLCGLVFAAALTLCSPDTAGESEKTAGQRSLTGPVITTGGLPPVTNVRAYRTSEYTIAVYYDLTARSSCFVGMEISFGDSAVFTPVESDITGDYGAAVSPGANKRILWRITPEIIDARDNLIIRVFTGLSHPVEHQKSVEPENLETSPILLTRLDSPVIFDGLSGEDAWKNVSPLPVVMQIPRFGSRPSERTEILLGYDDEYIYIAGRLYDSEPGRIQATTMKRDDDSSNSDSFGIVIDTFDDNENALAFITTPTGSRTDLTVTDSGHVSTNDTWNTVWDVRTVKNREGWFIEMRIPFSSLRFREGEDGVRMSIIAFRWIARKYERILFPPIPEKWGTSSHMKPSRAHAVSFSGVERSNPLYFTPYILGGIGQNYELDKTGTKYTRDDEPEHTAGFDLKYGLTSNLTLDVTYNTDFAQVEADDQQVNLTRYSLFFPEKRLFFLERSSNFDFNFYGSNRLFHSRTIGIHNGRKVPIYGGARIVGRAGRWDVGFLTMQTEEIDELPSENFSVARLRRQIFNPFSYVGGIATSRTGTDGSYNTAYGLDGIIRVFGDDYLKFNWAQTFENDRDNNILTPENAKYRVHWERYRYNEWSYGLNYSSSGLEYNPGMGFEQHPNFSRIVHFLRYGWMSGQKSPILLHQWYEDLFVHIRNSDRSLESYIVRTGWVYRMKSGYSGRFDVFADYEDVREHLSFSENAAVPVGEYEFYGLQGSFSTPGGGLFQLDSKFNVGQFYDGRRASVTLTPSRSISSHLEVGGTYQLNFIDFHKRDQRFDSHIIRLRLLAMLNVRLSVTSFVQFNSEADKIISNVRLRYNPSEGTDLYLVYDEGFNTDRYRDDPVLPVTDNRTIMLKYNHMFNL